MFKELLQIFIKFLYAPIIFPEMLWILTPVLLSIFLMDFYFLKYKREGIGHHKSLENTIFLLFVCFNLTYYVLSFPNSVKAYLVFFYIIFCIFIGLLDFIHKLPTELIFKTSSKFLVAYLSYVVIILVYSDLLNNLDFFTFMAILFSSVLLLMFFGAIKKIVSYLEPKSYEEIEHFLKHVEEDIRKAHEDAEKKEDKINKKSRKKKKKT